MFLFSLKQHTKSKQNHCHNTEISWGPEINYSSKEMLAYYYCYKSMQHNNNLFWIEREMKEKKKVVFECMYLYIEQLTIYATIQNQELVSMEKKLLFWNEWSTNYVVVVIIAGDWILTSEFSATKIFSHNLSSLSLFRIR